MIVAVYDRDVGTLNSSLPCARLMLHLTDIIDTESSYTQAQLIENAPITAQTTNQLLQQASRFRK